jgi:hypothetical protein
MRRLVSDVRELWRALRELFDPFDEEAARSAVTASAQRFSRRTHETLDDKLTFTATLMRAGEVEAANHMLAEVERDVRSEEAALIETVNEVRAVRAAQGVQLTRLRLARLVAVAMLGSLLMAGSAVGMTLARMLEERSSSSSVAVAAFQLGGPGRSAVERATDPRNLARRIKTFRIGALRVRLDASQARAYELIASGTVAGSELQALLALLPQQVQDVLDTATTTAAKTDPAAAGDAVETVVRDVKRKAKAEEQAKQEEEPEPEPSPEPSPSGGDSGGGGSGQEDDEGEQNGLILNDS